jgi:nucleotide-binding universal stress UspA family protein
MTAVRIVVGIDGSDASCEATRWAVGWAEALGGEVVAVHAIGLLEHGRGLGLDDAAQRALVAETWAAPLATAACPHRLELRDGAALDVLAMQVVVRSGDPAGTLLDVAEDIDADLVVLGSRGRGGPEDLMLGSVARTVADRVCRPTLVIPAAAGAVWLGPSGDDVPEPARPGPQEPPPPAGG